MMVPTNMVRSHHQAFLAEARIGTIVDDMMMPTNIGTSHHEFLADTWAATMIEAMLDANYLLYQGGLCCLPGAQSAQMITSHQGFAQEIVASTLMTITSYDATDLITVTMLTQSVAFIDITGTTFVTADQRRDAAMAYNWTNIYMPAARMDAMNNINRVTVIVLRL